jgi:hypothetical protein
MAVDVNSALSKAYDDLRSIDLDLSTLSGANDRYLILYILNYIYLLWIQF